MAVPKAMSNMLSKLMILLAFQPAWLIAGVSVDVQFVNGSGKNEVWTDQEKALAQEAAEVSFERLTQRHIMNCIARESAPGKFKVLEKNRQGKLVRKSLSKSEFLDLWHKQTGYLNKFKKFSLKMEKVALKGREIGRGKLSVAVIDRKNYELLNLAIKIDPEKIQKYEGKVRDFKDDKKSLWVNTIVHEITHNLGYSHESGADWKQNYEGFVPTVAGFCAASNGKYYKFTD